MTEFFISGFPSSRVSTAENFPRKRNLWSNSVRFHRRSKLRSGDIIFSSKKISWLGGSPILKVQEPLGWGWTFLNAWALAGFYFILLILRNCSDKPVCMFSNVPQHINMELQKETRRQIDRVQALLVTRLQKGCVITAVTFLNLCRSIDCNGKADKHQGEGTF